MRSLLIALCLLLALAFVTAEEAETFEVDETEEFVEAAQAEEVEEEEEVEDVQITKSPKKTGKKTGKAPVKTGKKTGKAPPAKTGKKTGKAPPAKTGAKTAVKTGAKTAVKPTMMKSPMATTLKPCFKKPYNGTFKKLNPPLGVSVNVTYRHFTKVQWRVPLDAPKNATFLVRYWNFDGPVFARGMKQKIKTKPGETFVRINKLLRPGLYRLRIRTVAKCFTKSDWANIQFNVTTRRQQIQLARLSNAQATKAILPTPTRSRV